MTNKLIQRYLSDQVSLLQTSKGDCCIICTDHLSPDEAGGGVIPLCSHNTAHVAHPHCLFDHFARCLRMGTIPVICPGGCGRGVAFEALSRAGFYQHVDRENLWGSYANGSRKAQVAAAAQWWDQAHIARGVIAREAELAEQLKAQRAREVEEHLHQEEMRRNGGRVQLYAL